MSCSEGSQSVALVQCSVRLSRAVHTLAPSNRATDVACTSPRTPNSSSEQQENKNFINISPQKEFSRISYFRIHVLALNNCGRHEARSAEDTLCAASERKKRPTVTSVDGEMDGFERRAVVCVALQSLCTSFPTLFRSRLSTHLATTPTSLQLHHVSAFVRHKTSKRRFVSGQWNIATLSFHKSHLALMATARYAIYWPPLLRGCMQNAVQYFAARANAGQ